jgi:predicted PurR-regulated permease PerM
MTDPQAASDDREFLSRATEATIRIAMVALLAAWCFQIVKPFIMPVVWGIIIATAIYPTYRWLARILGGRERTAAILLVLTGLILIIAPTVVSAGSLVESVQWLIAGLGDGSLEVPPPPENVATWPFIGERLHGIWSLANVNLMGAVQKLGPHLTPLAGGFFSAAAGVGLGVLHFVISIVLAGVFLISSRSGASTAEAIAARIVGDRGAEFVALSGATVRGVAQGILGVALIQSVLVAIGLLLPIIGYVFSTSGMTTSVVFAIWSVLASSSDTFLKPVLLARGLDLPMVVIFMGAIGGFVTSGFIGLFVGAVILALGYKLFMAWLDESRTPDRAEP